MFLAWSYVHLIQGNVTVLDVVQMQREHALQSHLTKSKKNLETEAGKLTV